MELLRRDFAGSGQNGRWRVNDLVMWDNRCTMHRRDSFDPDTRRLMHRTRSGQPDRRYRDSRLLDTKTVREVACPTCPAAPGAPCMIWNSIGGVRTWHPEYGAVSNHRERRLLAERLMACALSALA